MPADSALSVEELQDYRNADLADISIDSYTRTDRAAISVIDENTLVKFFYLTVAVIIFVSLALFLISIICMKKMFKKELESEREIIINLMQNNIPDQPDNEYESSIECEPLAVSFAAEMERILEDNEQSRKSEIKSLFNKAFSDMLEKLNGADLGRNSTPNLGSERAENIPVSDKGIDIQILINDYNSILSDSKKYNVFKKKYTIKNVGVREDCRNSMLYDVLPEDSMSEFSNGIKDGNLIAIFSDMEGDLCFVAPNPYSIDCEFEKGKECGFAKLFEDYEGNHSMLTKPAIFKRQCNEVDFSNFIEKGLLK